MAVVDGPTIFHSHQPLAISHQPLAMTSVVMMRLFRSTLPTPLGDMLALSSDEGLCALEFTTVKGRARGEERLSRLDARLARWFPAHDIVERETAIIARTRAWLIAYFDGTSAAVEDLPLDMRGAPFEKRVWTALRTIPAGQTTSYGAIAQALGTAGASRAVGAANGANPIAIVVPCHRVIGSNGSLTGYGGGLDRKTWLIDHERRWRIEPQASLF
jgi:methylated-DNA-[protein]-cysteine S-methyltransferase